MSGSDVTNIKDRINEKAREERAKRLPPEIVMQAIMYFPGPEGYYFQKAYEPELGVFQNQLREAADAEIQQIWIKAGFKGQYSSYQKLRRAYNASLKSQQPTGG